VIGESSVMSAKTPFGCRM